MRGAPEKLRGALCARFVRSMMASFEWLTTTKSRAQTHLEAHLNNRNSRHIMPRPCNFRPQYVIKRSSRQKKTGEQITEERRWKRSQTHPNARPLQNRSWSNMLLGTWLVIRGLPLELQRDSVVVDHDELAAAHRSGDDLSYYRGRAGSVL